MLFSLISRLIFLQSFESLSVDVDLGENSLIFLALLGMISMGMQVKSFFFALPVKEAPLRNEHIVINQKIENMGREKDWLVKELHHRVKNNLQMMVSLLNTQSMYLKDQESIQAITKSRHRLFAMALVHQKLYQGTDLSSIDFAQYLQEMVEYLKDEYDPPNNISFEVDAVALQLNVNIAIPLGIIINEAVSNALRYAFPLKKDGKITISLKRKNKECYMLEIQDNGIGMENLDDQYADQTLGKSLMSGLSHQIQSELKIFNNNGILITMEFSPMGMPDCHQN